MRREYPSATAHPDSSADVRPSPKDCDHAREVARFFDRGANSWRIRYESPTFDAYNYQERARVALEWLAEVRESKGADPVLLEIGCGAGVQSARAVSQGWRVIAGDFSLGILGEASSRSREPAWTVFDAEKLPIHPHSLDAVLLLGVIGYLKDPAAALRNIRELLKPDGTLVISWYSEGPYLLDRIGSAVSFLPDQAYTFIKKRLFGHTPPECAEKGFYRKHNQAFPPPDFVKMLHGAGFVIEDQRSVNFGALRLMGCRLWGDAGDIRASRVVEAMQQFIPDCAAASARTHLARAAPIRPSPGAAGGPAGTDASAMRTP